MLPNRADCSDTRVANASQLTEQSYGVLSDVARDAFNHLRLFLTSPSLTDSGFNRSRLWITLAKNNGLIMSISREPPGKVGFVTTCKGRLHHLKQTLPQIVAQKPDKVVVVDHDCPQNSGAWVKDNFPEVEVVYINDGSPFIVSKARNVGIRACDTEVICLIDADITITPGFVDWIRQRVVERRFFRQDLVEGRRVHDTWGTVVCPRKLLLEIGLYDEAFDGWGGEDNDLYHRLEQKEA